MDTFLLDLKQVAAGANDELRRPAVFASPRLENMDVAGDEHLHGAGNALADGFADDGEFLGDSGKVPRKTLEASPGFFKAALSKSPLRLIKEALVALPFLLSFLQQFLVDQPPQRRQEF